MKKITSIKNKRIYIIYTGGTIGMVKTRKGYIPRKGYLLNRLKSIKDLYNNNVPNFLINEYPNLIDSANISPKDWSTIALDILDNYEKYDGFIVLHGTDTLAYTASSLSFMLKNLSKPVICTGSQIPISEVRSDALDNILHSLILAADSRISEVCIYFNKKLLRGNRSVKTSSLGMDAFSSPNYPVLGEVGIDIKLNEAFLYHNESNSPITIECDPFKTPRIAILSIFPGINTETFKQILCPPLQGLILKTYGSGNIMDSNKILCELMNAYERGVTILNCTQCLKGSVRTGVYETSLKLSSIGVISGKDITDEAALTKLSYLLSISRLNQIDIQSELNKNLRGEVTL